jgi:hypothetical protein
MSFGSEILRFYKSLSFDDELIPNEIEVMNPFNDSTILNINKEFYEKYYPDNNKRIFLIGINPGRFGGGMTGIPFTDPINLENILGIKNSLTKKHELSSRFVYDVILASGGASLFFSRYYLTAISPLGFTMDGKNINYYDHKDLMTQNESNFVKWLEIQIQIGGNQEIAYSLGRGKNFTYLKYLNSKYKLFQKVDQLPHPRWVMQYRYPKREEFVDFYTRKLASHTIC